MDVEEFVCNVPNVTSLLLSNDSSPAADRVPRGCLLRLPPKDGNTIRRLLFSSFVVDDDDDDDDDDGPLFIAEEDFIILLLLPKTSFVYLPCLMLIQAEDDGTYTL